MAVKDKLFAELRNAVDNNDGILPSEVELSAKLGISRTQIRDYLAIYENERLIVRQRRKGTKVIKDVLDIPLRMDFDLPYKERFKAMGYSSASSVIIFIITIGFSIANFKKNKKEVA